MKKRNYTNPEVRKTMYDELHTLMKQAEDDIFVDKGEPYYDSSTHYHLMKNAWEIMFPAKREEWPSIFDDVQVDKQLPWPQGASYSYIMSVIAPPFVNHHAIYFGYAVVEGKLIRTTFFVFQDVVKYQIMPQAMVIDPLCIAHGIEPEYYIGCLAEKEDVHGFLSHRKNPLEVYVNRKNKKEHEERIYNSYMEAYHLQMTYEPNWFPSQLIEFAKKHNLHIPPQGWQ